jgi:hypothetical protein
LSFSKALFIHSHSSDVLDLPPGQTPGHGPLQRPLRRRPAHAQKLPCILHAPGAPQHLHRQPFKSQRPAAARLRPRNLHPLRLQQGLILPEIQIPPRSLFRLCMCSRLPGSGSPHAVSSQRTFGTTLRAAWSICTSTSLHGAWSPISTARSFLVIPDFQPSTRPSSSYFHHAFPR